MSDWFDDPSAPLTRDDVRVEIHNFLRGQSALGSYAPTSVPWSALNVPNADAPVPVGFMGPYAALTAPAKWVLCDGASYSTSDKKDLFAVIIYTYGGSGMSFNVPDMRGRFAMGAGTGVGLGASGTGAPSGTALTARVRGQWGGEQRMPSHSHSVPSHTHSAISTAGTGGGAGVADWTVGGASVANNVTFGTTGATGGTTGTAGTGVFADDILPPVIVTNYIIKAVW